MKDLTKFFNPILTENQMDTQYEVIENETLKSRNLNGLHISGSLFSLTNFNHVTFESCVFYASKIENCFFKNCHFNNCTFQFTDISHCRFVANSFNNCIWDYSPVKESDFLFCSLDAKTSYFIDITSNSLLSCQSNQVLTWNEDSGQDQLTDLPAIPNVGNNADQTPGVQRELNDLTKTFCDFLFGKKLAA